jgi:hypothetical protein
LTRFDQRAVAFLEVAQPIRPAVAELAGPDAELMAAVDAGQRPHARPQRAAAEHLQGLPIVALAPVGGQAKQLGAIEAGGDPVGLGHRCGNQVGEEFAAQPAEPIRPGEVRLTGIGGVLQHGVHRR